MKKELSIFTAAALVLALTACAAPKNENPPAQSSQAAAKETTQEAAKETTKETAKETEKPTLIVSNFALADDKIKESVIEPFEEEFNCTVIYEGGTNAERLTKLKNDPNTDVDVIYLSQQFAQQGVEAGVFKEIDYSRIPNAADLLDKAQIFIDSKQGPPNTMNRLAIIYNPEKAGEITSFADIWRPEFKGQVAIPDITTTFGPAMVAVASDYAGVDYTTDGGEAAFKALEELKPNIVNVYTKSSDLKNMFEAGEISIALAAEFAYNTMGDSNVGLKFIDPEEGSYLNFNTINIVKTTDQEDLAYEFINFILSKESQERTAIKVPGSAVNKTAEIPEEVAKKLTTVEVAEQANVLDYEYINVHLKDWIDLWNRTLNQ